MSSVVLPMSFGFVLLKNVEVLSNTLTKEAYGMSDFKPLPPRGRDIKKALPISQKSLSYLKAV